MKVYILPEVHAEIMFYVEKSHLEISGLGRVEKDSNGNLVVSKIYLLNQENTGASTDICPKAVSKLMYTSREDKGNLNFWWHSHVTMEAFWSSTDMATIEQFGKNGYLLSTVFNKQGDHRTSYFQGGNNFLPSLFVDEIETYFEHIPSEAQITKWSSEYEAKCKAYTYTPTSYVGGEQLEMFEDDFGYDNWWKNPKKKTPELPIDDYLETDFEYMTEKEYAEWEQYYILVNNTKSKIVPERKLEAFFVNWKGDFDAMKRWAINRVATRNIQEGLQNEI